VRLTAAKGIGGLLGTLAIASAAACSSPNDLGAYDPGTSTPPAQSIPGSGGSNAAAQAPTTVNPATGQSQPVPTSGPGSMNSPARLFFISDVYPKLAVCVNCHANGTLGAPGFLGKDAPSSYAGLDARGLIQQNSLFVTKGTHAAGAAAPLDATQLAAVNQWLAMEAQERVGQAAPVNILEKMGDCLDEALFNAIQFQNLRTTRRENENANTCTGCNQAPCRTCHTGGDGNFYMSVGSVLDTATFAETKTPKYIVKYLGLNGTTPVSSNAIALKGQATTTDKPYSHPMYTINAEMQTRIDAFVNNAITKYNAKQCGQ